MKKLTLALLACIFLIACNQKAAEKTEEVKEETEKTETATDETDEKEEPISDEVSLESEVKEVKVISFKGKKEDSGEQEIEIALGKGYSVYEKNSEFSGSDWYCEKFEIRKDGKTIYKHPVNDEQSIPFRSRKHYPEIPRLATKGNNAAFICEIIIKPNDMMYKAFLFKDEKFVKAVKVQGTILTKPEELKALFDKEFK